MLKQSSFFADGKILSNKWKVLKNFEIILNPINVNFTNEIFDFIYDFLWSSNITQTTPQITNELLENNEYQEQLDKDYLYRPDSYLRQITKSAKKNKKMIKTKDQEELIPQYFHRFRINANQIILNYNTSNLLTVS